MAQITKRNETFKDSTKRDTTPLTKSLGARYDGHLVIVCDLKRLAATRRPRWWH